MSVSTQIHDLLAALPRGTELVAVSKTYPAEAVMEAYRAGQRIFGENRPQELAAKASLLPRDIRWHMIGHLQTNKVRMIVPWVELIHSVDSARLLEVIDREARRAGRTVDCLLEVRIACEQTKHGWDAADLRSYLAAAEWRALSGVRLRGLMGMATNTPDREQVRREFEELARLRAELAAEFFDEPFDILSMGMSTDYPIALACGATMVRIGSRIFGARE